MNDDLDKMQEELREGIASLNSSLHGAGVKLDRFGRAVKENTKKSTTRKVTDALIETAQVFRSLGDSTSSIETMKPIMHKTIDMFGSVAGMVPKVGDALQNLSRVAAQTSDAAIDEMAAQAKAFHSLSSVGGTVADGLTGLQHQWFQSTMHLESFTKALTSSATTLARFGTTVSQGAESYSKIIGELAQGDDDRLRMLGFTTEDMAESTATYLDIQTKLGKSQTLSAKELTAGAKQYSFELDILARATGASRAEIEKFQKELMNEDKFAATMFLMEQKGQEKQINEIKNIQTLLMKNAGPNITKGFRDTLSEGGLAYSETAKILAVQTGGASVEIAKNLKEGRINAEEAERQLRESLRKNSDSVATNASIMGESVGIYGKNFHEIRDFVNSGEDALSKARRQQEEQTKREDEFTKNVIKTEKAMEMSYIDFHKLISKTMPLYQNGLVLATEALTGLAGGVDKFTGGATLTTGGGLSEPGGPGGPGGEVIGEATGNAVVDQARKMLGKNEYVNEKELTEYLNAYSGSYRASVKGELNAWCARFVNATLEASGLKGNKRQDAASFKTFGQEVFDPSKGMGGITNARPGDVVVIKSPTRSGSHVAIFEGYDPATGKVEVVGGNQSDSVSEASYDLRKIQAIRRATSAEKGTEAAQPAQTPATTKPAEPEAQPPQAPVTTRPEAQPAPSTNKPPESGKTTAKAPAKTSAARVPKPTVIANAQARPAFAEQPTRGITSPPTPPTVNQAVANVETARREQQATTGQPAFVSPGRPEAGIDITAPQTSLASTTQPLDSSPAKLTSPTFTRPPLPAVGLTTPDTSLAGPTNEYASQVESPAQDIATPDTSVAAETDQKDILLDNMIESVAKRSAKMDELIALMRKQNGTSDKMLKVKS